MPYENANPFAEYLEKMRELEQAVKLTAYHTLECARQAEKAADYSLLAVYHVKEILNER
uniref:Uncharacterized protein n=1 Tax=viral metagenome TaxID=1070528 RepID=A0A6M3L0E6_9ZZZZ